MRLRDSFDGGSAPFQGDRATLLQTIPVNARIERATVTVTPVDATRGAEPFAEATTFDGVVGVWGATKSTEAGQWVEVDFHARRTLVGVSGLNLAGTTLQVDFGGVYVDLNPTGSIRTPSDPNPFPVESNTQRLPGLTVNKIKLTNRTGQVTTPDVTQVTFRSLPSNVTLRIGESAPFWARVGELVAPETTPDFAPLLQAFLAKARSENGFFNVPLVLHTDAPARLGISLEVDYLVEQSVLPPGLDEVTLSFDLSTRPQTTPGMLSIAVPANARIARRGATARVNGVFEPTRLVAETVSNVAPAASVEVSPALSHAQPVRLGVEAVASEVDLLLNVSRSAKLQLDIREDLDGKPGPASFLPAPIALALPGPMGLTPERRGEGETKWLSVRLPAEVQFKAGTAYWLVLQCLEGVFEWKVAPAPGEAVTLQRTDTGGLSWRDENSAAGGGPLKAFFRLRRHPETFEIPIELQIGEGTDAVHLKMDRFQPLGRVDFDLDPDDLSKAINEHLDKAARSLSCAGVEHLANKDYKQWLRVGDAPQPVTSIHLDSSPRSVAFAPDGAWAYVGLAAHDGESGSLHVVDVACDALVRQEIALDFTPDVLVVSPTGTRAYVTDGGRLRIIDTTTHKSLGAVNGSRSEGRGIAALAVSPDGARLYAAVGNSFAGNGNRNVFDIALVETAQLERAATQGWPAGDVPSPLKTLSLSSESVSLAVSPDGSLLYVTTVEPQSRRGELRIVDAFTLRAPGEIVLVGKEPSGVALSADGKRAVVVNAADNTLSVVDTATRSTVATIKVDEPGADLRPFAVALSPEGTRAYVAGRRIQSVFKPDALSIVDVDKGVVVEVIDMGASSTAVALTPQGDHLYWAASASNVSPPDAQLFSMQFGKRLPAEWNLTSGTVSPMCYPEPHRVIARLGDFRQVETQMPTTLSQVVPVAPLCSFDFSFEALATQPSAVAEVFWIDADCGLLRTDQVPIESLRTPSESVSFQLLSAMLKQALDERPPLVFHRRRLSAPEGAAQAEVRFNVPPDILALVGSTSLVGTDEALQNSDLALRKEGQPDGWRLLPAFAPGVSLSGVRDEIQLSNSGAAPAELMQTVPVEGGRPFALKLKGRAEARPTASANPSLELRWFKKDDSQAAAPVVLNLSPNSFESAAADGTTPPDAARAEIHLIVPPGTTQTIGNVSFQLLPVVNVPVTFIAQAPGELSVFDWRIAFEAANAAKPPIPEKGLCVATPPGRTPGRMHDDHHYCPQCGEEQPVAESTSASSRAGRPASIKECSVCGTKSVSFGGRSATGTMPLATYLSPARASAVSASGHATTGAPSESVGGIPAQPFAAVVGIGPVRSMHLASIGINSLEMLAAATPEDVMQVKGIPLKLAADFIRQANQLLAPDSNT